jgi:hypothetical protein
MTQYAPAIDLSQGSGGGGEIGATFSCSWKNTLNKEIVWGVGDNEMCMMYGYAYPPSAAYSAIASDRECLTLLP